MNRRSFDRLLALFAMFAILPLATLHPDWVEKTLFAAYLTCVVGFVVWIGEKLRDRNGRWLQVGAVVGWLLSLGFCHAVGAI